MTTDPTTKSGDDHPDHLCVVCGTRMSPWLIQRGEKTHPCCDPDGLLS
jgi:hypothetical protein